MCTGNICRSPMAEALLREHLRSRGVEARVRSAGTTAWTANATEHTVTVMRERGLDVSAHTPQQLDASSIGEADLVIGMTRAHVWRANALAPDAEDRTFLVGELARLGASVGSRRPDEPVRAWAGRVAATRPAGAVVGRGDDEVPDPIGEPVEVYRATAERLDLELRVVAALLAP